MCYWREETHHLRHHHLPRCYLSSQCRRPLLNRLTAEAESCCRRQDRQGSPDCHRHRPSRGPPHYQSQDRYPRHFGRLCQRRDHLQGKHQRHPQHRRLRRARPGYCRQADLIVVVSSLAIKVNSPIHHNSTSRQPDDRLCAQNIRLKAHCNAFWNGNGREVIDVVSLRIKGWIEVGGIEFDGCIRLKASEI